MPDNHGHAEGLGYGVLFITAWMVALPMVEWAQPDGSLVGALPLVMGGLVLPIAGILAYKGAREIDGTLFVGLGGLFAIIGLNSLLGGSEGLAVYEGWFGLVWGIFLGGLGLGAWNTSGLRAAVILVLGLGGLIGGLANLIGSSLLWIVAGYAALIGALLAGYRSAALLIGQSSRSEA